MRVTGILCSVETIQQLRDSQRWQLRRPIAVPRGLVIDGTAEEMREADRSEPIAICSGARHGRPSFLHCPYGRADDWLFVRERWRLERRARGAHATARTLLYEADLRPDMASEADLRARWVSAQLMPESAARLWLRIYRVRAMRLQAASHFDIASEGAVCPVHDTDQSYCQSECELRRQVFAECWDRRYSAAPYRYRDNPWVWALSVTRFPPLRARDEIARARELERLGEPQPAQFARPRMRSAAKNARGRTQ